MTGVSPQTVLVVEDEDAIAEAVRARLESEGYRVVIASDGPEAIRSHAEHRPDLVVLDLMLPGMDGLEVCTRIQRDGWTPVLMLTARTEEADKVAGFAVGADDYLTKPFSTRELLARIRTVLRRRHAEVRQGKPEGIRAYRFDGWELNLNMRRLTARDGRVVPLSNGEFSLLVVLLGAPSRILSRDQLLDLSRLHNDEVFNRSVDVQIMRLRRKIEPDAAQPRYIRTERGAGYLFGVPVETIY
jgi:DNA-binding response OmpR family regulator